MTSYIPAPTATHFEALWMVAYISSNYDVTEEDAKRIINDLTSDSNAKLADIAHQQAVSFLEEKLDVDPSELQKSACEAKQDALAAREERLETKSWD
ncbi:hypothetical protein [Natronococcus sp.]|uniref:hypothetical protein n=1 Tax=Natronococcus sp. TaxID=35747 RepID=UPI003A4E2042